MVLCSQRAKAALALVVSNKEHSMMSSDWLRVTLLLSEISRSLAWEKNRRLVRACDYCGDVQLKNMEIEHLRNILLEGATYMKKYEN